MKVHCLEYGLEEGCVGAQRRDTVLSLHPHSHDALRIALGGSFPLLSCCSTYQFCLGVSNLVHLESILYSSTVELKMKMLGGKL